MRRGTGGSSGRFEYLVILLIALAGIAVAGAVALTPWHPTVAGRHRITDAVISVDSPHDAKLPDSVAAARRR